MTGWPTRTYIQQLCVDTGCSPEDLPGAMNDREEWQERVRDICADGITRWWWWWCYLALVEKPVQTKNSKYEYFTSVVSHVDRNSVLYGNACAHSLTTTQSSGLRKRWLYLHQSYVYMVHPYSSMDTTTTWKKLRFISADRSDFHMANNRSVAVHAFARRIFM